MKFSTEKELQCTHCGAIKDRLDLHCYYFWDKGECSDLRELAPQQAVPAIVQFCPSCRRFYHIEKEGVVIKSIGDFNWIDPVTYDAIKPSIVEYDKFEWSAAAEYNQRLRLLWAYNDFFYRENEQRIPAEDDKMIAKWNLLHLTNFFRDPIMIAELLREAEMFDECLKVANKASLNIKNNPMLEHIVTLAESQNNKPFKIMQKEHI